MPPPLAHKPKPSSACPLESLLSVPQTLLDSAGVGIVVIRERAVAHCNQGYADILRLESPAHAIGTSSVLLHSHAEAFHTFWHTALPLLARGETWRGEQPMRRGNGEPFWAQLTGRLLDAHSPDNGSIWIVMDVSERQRQQREHERNQERIHRLAHYDALTGLPNRVLLAQRSSEAIARAHDVGTPLAVMFLDLDNFKHVNDSLGHSVGDALLVEVGKRLRAVVRERDTVARLGGDEFVLLLCGADAQGAARVAAKMQEAAREPFCAAHREFSVALSMGIALYPEHGEDFETLLQAADTAMYRAKSGGRNDFRFFTPEMHAESTRALQLDHALRRALDQGQLELHYQPQLDMQSGALVGVEALARWHHPALGAISPLEFIPIAEASGLILQLGEWVLENALRQLRAWHEAGMPQLTMAVNLSALQLRQHDFLERVQRLLDACAIAPRSLELELTEGSAMHDPQAASAAMGKLHSQGVRVAIDDFGTGYSSLSQLQRFRISKLKIDQSFVRDLEHSAQDRTIVSAIIRMAQALGMRTTAEGVESARQMAYLRAQGCDEVQGYYVSAPLPARAMTALLQTHRRA